MSYNKSQLKLPRPFRLSEATLLAVLTFIGYLTAYATKFAYLSYFNIPTYFIEVGVPSVLEAAFFIAIYIAFWFLVADYLFRAGWLTKYPVVQRFAPPLLFFLAFLGPLVVITYDRNYFWFWLALNSAFIIIAALAVVKRTNSEVEDDSEKGSESKQGLALRSAELMGPELVLCLLLTMTLIFYGTGVGLFRARTQVDYPIVVQNSEPSSIAIIGSEGNELIGVPFDKDTHVLTGGMLLVNKDTMLSQNIILEESSVGPLRGIDSTKVLLLFPFPFR